MKLNPLVLSYNYLGQLLLPGNRLLCTALQNIQINHTHTHMPFALIINMFCLLQEDVFVCTVFCLREQGLIKNEEGNMPTKCAGRQQNGTDWIAQSTNK